MRLANNGQSLDSLRMQIRDLFADLNRRSAPSRGRQYPSELRALVRQAYSSGISIVELRKLSGMSNTAVRGALKQGSDSKGRSAPSVKGPPPRRLEVVTSQCETRAPRGPLVIRLPSGVTIELADAGSLTASLLHSLANIEVSHAASR